VRQLHSTDYRNPAQIGDGPVLVVGGGNTGYQIAEELAATREVHLAIGTRQLALPQRIVGRDLFDVLTAAGVMRKTVDSPIGRRMRERDTLIGSSPRRTRRLGVRLHARAMQASETTITFADGDSIEPATVIWATGFDVDHSWIDAPVFDEDRRLRHRRGITPAPGLYFLGLPWQHTRGSALLGWVDDDARHIAGAIERLRPTVARVKAAA
jgi:putative flavoprotein involved in K+ transport